MLNWKRSIAISAFGLAAMSAVAEDRPYDSSYDSKSSGAMVLLPPRAGYIADADEGAVWLHLAGREYRSGSGWWALRCKEACDLVPLNLTVTSKDHERYDDTPMQGQLLQFAPQLPADGVIAVFKPFRAPLDKLQLKQGPVTSWVPGRTCKPKAGVRHIGGQVMGGELLLPGGEKLVFAPRPKSLEEKAGEEGIIELELRTGGKRQWLANFGFDINWGEGSRWEPANYVRWVGDLDNDGKPDFIIETDANYSNLTLYLSSLAGPGEIVGMAGSFSYFAPNQAGC